MKVLVKTMDKLILILAVLTSLMSCQGQEIDCKSNRQEILYYENTILQRADIIPCQKIEYQFKDDLFKRKENVLKNKNLFNSKCSIEKEGLVNLNLITGYNPEEDSAKVDYIIDFQSNYLVEYIGSVTGEEQTFYDLIYVSSKKADQTFFERELFILVNLGSEIKSIVKIGNYSSYKPDYSSNMLFTINDGMDFSLFDFSNMNADLSDLNKYEFICSNFKIDDKGRVQYLE